MDTNEKLSFLLKMLQCSGPISYWSYNSKGELTASSGTWDTLYMFFERSGCLQYALDAAGGAPMCLGSPFGALWGVVFSGEGEEREIHVIGPVLNTDLTEKALENVARRYISTYKLRKFFIKMMHELPVIPITLFRHHILMLHCCLNDETLETSDIIYQNKPDTPEKYTSPAAGTREHAYKTTKQLLFHLKEGDTNYRKASTLALSSDLELHIRTKDPFTPSLLSAVSFVSLCKWAAIEGGLPPDTACTVEDSYVQSMVDCQNVSELSSIGHAMYDEFVKRVHKLRASSSLSPQILACCEYIRLHPEEDLSISFLAKQAGYTDYYLSRKFKAETGTNIRSYIDSVRINRAQMMLTATDMPILEIAQTLHYCSGSHFSTVFRRLTGKLPGEYRREHM